MLEWCVSKQHRYKEGDRCWIANNILPTMGVCEEQWRQIQAKQRYWCVRG